VRFKSRRVAFAIPFIVAGCSADGPTANDGNKINLTQAQVSLLVARVAQIVPVHPELSWLGDSASLVLTSGAEADRLNITTDLGAGPFFGVGMHRAITASANSFSTFHLIVFNDPSNPTDFIIIDGFMQGSGATPPTSMSGNVGGSAVNGYLFHIAGSTLDSWRAESGSASFVTGSSVGDCQNFQSIVGITCARIGLEASFNIDVARRDAGGQAADTRSASLAPVTVAGIRLTILAP
jgi:hypothetical protein